VVEVGCPAVVVAVFGPVVAVARLAAADSGLAAGYPAAVVAGSDLEAAAVACPVAGSGLAAAVAA
jgi:hypothetical protein